MSKLITNLQEASATNDPTVCFQRALRKIRVDEKPFFMDEMLEFYIVSVMSSSILTSFLYSPASDSESSPSFVTDKPISVRYSEAIFSASDRQLVLLKSLAEQLLWMSAISPAFLVGKNKSPDIDYYHTIGRMSFLRLSDNLNRKQGGEEFSSVYRKSSEHFSELARLIGRTMKSI